MFDMGFTELMLIGIVALIVIGPERLPGVARTAGKYFGRLKRFMTTVKADVEQELRADELREILAQQQKELDKLKDNITDAGREIEKQADVVGEAGAEIAAGLDQQGSEPATRATADTSQESPAETEPAAEPEKIAETPAAGSRQ